MDLKDVRYFKILLIATELMWLIYDTLIKSYTSAAFDFATMLANTIVLIKLEIDYKNCKITKEQLEKTN